VVPDVGRSPSSPSQEKRRHETQRKRYYLDRNGGLKKDFFLISGTNSIWFRTKDLDGEDKVEVSLELIFKPAPFAT